MSEVNIQLKVDGNPFKIGDEVKFLYSGWFFKNDVTGRISGMNDRELRVKDRYIEKLIGDYQIAFRCSPRRSKGYKLHKITELRKQT